MEETKVLVVALAVIVQASQENLPVVALQRKQHSFQLLELITLSLSAQVEPPERPEPAQQQVQTVYLPRSLQLAVVEEYITLLAVMAVPVVAHRTASLVEQEHPDKDTPAEPHHLQTFSVVAVEELARLEQMQEPTLEMVVLEYLLALPEQLLLAPAVVAVEPIREALMALVALVAAVTVAAAMQELPTLVLVVAEVTGMVLQVRQVALAVLAWLS